MRDQHEFNYDQILADGLARPSKPCEGRVALVVGGGLSGEHGSVGFATAWALAQEGAKVIIADRDYAAAERARSLIAAEGMTAASVIGDVVDDLACEKIVNDAAEIFGGFDAVVTTVASGEMIGILDADRAHWDKSIAVNLTSAWGIIRHASNVLPPGSSIVTTSSGAAASRGPGTPYNVAKAALEQLTVGAAASLAPRGIRVNAVRVGTIWSTFASRAFSEDVRKERAAQTALQQEGNVWDIAAANAFLTGNRARWITGQILAVDGGGIVQSQLGHPGAAEASNIQMQSDDR